MRTDSAGAVSVTALSQGDESPASKRRSIELDTIIAEGEVNEKLVPTLKSGLNRFACKGDGFSLGHMTIQFACA